MVAQTVKRLPTMRETRVQSLGWEDSPGEGNGNPLQYYCQENPMDRGAWYATVHGVAKSRTRLSDWSDLMSDFPLNIQSIDTLPSSSYPGLVAQMVKHLTATWETRVRFLCGEDSLEKEMATHSNTFAWRIPWREEPGRDHKESDTTEQLHFTSLHIYVNERYWPVIFFLYLCDFSFIRVL